MVLLARSLQRSLRPVSASARALSTSSTAFTSRASTTCRAGVTSRPALAPKSSTPLSLPSRNPFGAPASIRSLTGQREKVKVLLVLYDGGKHAEEVRYISFFSRMGKRKQSISPEAGFGQARALMLFFRAQTSSCQLSVGARALVHLHPLPRANQEPWLVVGLLVDSEGKEWLAFLGFSAAARSPCI